MLPANACRDLRSPAANFSSFSSLSKSAPVTVPLAMSFLTLSWERAKGKAATVGADAAEVAGVEATGLPGEAAAGVPGVEVAEVAAVEGFTGFSFWSQLLNAFGCVSSAKAAPVASEATTTVAAMSPT